MTKTIEIPEGYKLIEDGDNYKIVPKENKFPESWEDLEGVEGFYLTNRAEIKKISTRLKSGCHKNTIPTEEEAEGILAMCQLMQLRDRVTGDWRVNEHDKHTHNYHIINESGVIEVDSGDGYYGWLYFLNRDNARRFLDTHRELITQAKMFL